MFTTVLAVIGVVLGAGSALLHLFKPKAGTLAFTVEEVVDEVLKFLGQHNDEGTPTEVAEPGTTK